MSKILPVFLPFVGCGNKCTYCNQSAITNTSEPTNLLQSAIEQITTYKQYSDTWQELAFYGGNFGAINSDIRKQLYSLASENSIEKIRYSTRPDTINDTLLHEAEKHNVSHIELGIQSLDDEVLRINKRPYSSADVFNAVNDINSVATCGAQVMVGMYGGDVFRVVDDSKRLSEAGITTARIYPTIVLKDTELEQLYNQGKYKPIELDKVLLVTAFSYIHYISSDIDVIRIGLPNDVYTSDAYIAGAYHNSLGDLVKTLVALIYSDLGGCVKFSGHLGAVRRLFSDNYERAEAHVDFIKICKFLKEKMYEDSERIIESKANHFAKQLTS